MPKILPRKCPDYKYYEKASDIVQEYIERFGAGFHEIDELDCMIASALREAAEHGVQRTAMPYCFTASTYGLFGFPEKARGK